MPEATRRQPATLPRLAPVRPRPVSLASRLAQLRAEVAALEEQQRAEIVAAVALFVGPGCTFSAREVWEHRIVSPPLSNALADAGIRNARQLGKKLRALGFDRIGVDERGVVWTCG